MQHAAGRVVEQEKAEYPVVGLIDHLVVGQLDFPVGLGSQSVVGQTKRPVGSVH